MGTRSPFSRATPSLAACCGTPCRNTACLRRCWIAKSRSSAAWGQFRLRHLVGEDLTLNELDAGFDAVFLSIGTWKEYWVYLPGTELAGVRPALPFLEGVATGEPMPLGHHAAVIGGGNAAIDSARTAVRLGASATVIYRRERKDMPAIDEEVEAAEQEGVRFVFLAAPHRIVGEHGEVKGIEVAKTRLGEFDSSGRRRPISTDEVRMIRCSSVILAVGEAVDRDFCRASGLRLKESGVLDVNRYPWRPAAKSFSPAATWSPAPPTSPTPWASARRRRAKSTAASAAVAVRRYPAEIHLQPKAAGARTLPPPSRPGFAGRRPRARTSLRRCKSCRPRRLRARPLAACAATSAKTAAVPPSTLRRSRRASSNLSTYRRRTCSAIEGQTIFQVAKANGKVIPSLCHMEGLSSAGSCRLCLVEVSGMTACCPPAPPRFSAAWRSRPSRTA